VRGISVFLRALNSRCKAALLSTNPTTYVSQVYTSGEAVVSECMLSAGLRFATSDSEDYFKPRCNFISQYSVG
jgi:hypothetical protein